MEGTEDRSVTTGLDEFLGSDLSLNRQILYILYILLAIIFANDT